MIKHNDDLGPCYLHDVGPLSQQSQDILEHFVLQYFNKLHRDADFTLQLK